MPDGDGAADQRAAHPVLEAVCVMHAPVSDRGKGDTAIDKRAVPGPVAVATLGLAGDTQFDTANHGGRDQALYAYAGEDKDFWAGELARPLTAGVFGENLVTRGVDVTGAVLGERWVVGDPAGGQPVVLEVSMPRVPCATFQAWLGEAHWVKRFTDAARPGAYLRVLTGGLLRAGDPVAVVDRPAHGVTIGEVFRPRRVDPDRLRAAIAGDDVPATLVAWVTDALRLGPVRP